MAADLSEQRAVLERELARLEQLLQADANWRALQAAEQRPVIVLGEHDVSRDEEIERIQDGLKSNRIYCARERILEALALVCREEQRSTNEHNTAPKTIQQRLKLTKKSGSEARAVRPSGLTEKVAEAQATKLNLAPNTTIAVPMPTAGRRLSDARDSGGAKLQKARGVDANVKANIRTAPPETPFQAGPTSSRPADDLTAIRGLTRARADSLIGMGVKHFDQIAAWTPNDVQTISAALDLGRDISRLNWIEQAALLAQRVTPSADTAEAPNKSAAASSATEKPTTEDAETTEAELLVSTHSEVETREEVTTDVHIERNGEIQHGGDAPKKDETVVAAEVLPAVKTTVGSTAVANIPQLVSNAASSVFFNNAFEPTTNSPPDWLVKAAARRIFTRVQRGEADPVQGSRHYKFLSSSTDNTQAIGSTGEDDLQLIQNIDESLARQLANEGVTRFADIAAFNSEDIANISAALGLGNRISCEGWIEQAALLARGKKTQYAKRVADNSRQLTNRVPSAQVLPPPLPASHQSGTSRGKRDPIQHWDVLTKQPLDVEIDGIDTISPTPVKADLDVDHDDSHSHAPKGFGVGLRRFDAEADVAIVAVSGQKEAINGGPDPMGSHDGDGRKSLAARLRRANNRAQPVDARRYAGYRSEVPEASVEIVRYKRPDGAVAHVPTEEPISQQIGDGRAPLVEPEEKRHWFKSLIGR